MPIATTIGRDYAHNQDLIVRAKILAYSASTWKSHSSTFTAFVKSCASKGIDLEMK
jgi:hypothetical protein